MVIVGSTSWWLIVSGFGILVLVILWDRFILGKHQDEVRELRMTNAKERAQRSIAERHVEFLEAQLEDEIDDAASVRKKAALLEQMNHALFEANKILLEAELKRREKNARLRASRKKGDT